MKLRIKGNSIRLRLTRPEVEQLARDGRVIETTRFSADRQLRYQVETASHLSSLVAALDADTITVSVPMAGIHEWAASETVSLRGEQRIGDDSLTILIEKDFQCLKPRDEDERDMFPHPGAS